MTNVKITRFFSAILSLVLCLCICAGSVLGDDFVLYSGGDEPGVSYEKSVDGKTFYIECYNIDEYPVAIILALYNGEKLVDIKTSRGYSSQATFTTSCEYDRECVMVWDSLKSMNPIVTSENVVSPLSTVGKIEGVLVATSRSGDLNKNEISYTFNLNRVYGDDEWTEFIKSNYYYFGDYSGLVTADYILADSLGDVSDFLQLASVIHFRKAATGKYEVCAITPGEIGSTVEIGLDDIDDVEAGGGSVNYDAILYYPSASSTKTSKYKIDLNADYYYNYSVIYGIEEFDEIIRDWDTGEILYGADMEITLVENDGDSYYDAVMVKEYTYDIVNAVDTDMNVIEGYCEDVTVELDDEEVFVFMKNADGEEITLDDFSKGDVIAYITSNGQRKNYDWIEIINLGENSVTGVVDEVDAHNGVIYVNSTEYGVVGIEMPYLGDEGTFYLTRTGKIFFIDTAVNIEYAYVLNAAFNDADFTEAWQLQLLTSDNEVVIYTVRDEFEFDYEYVSAKTADCNVLEAYEAQWDWEGEDLDKGAHRVITYKLDSKNKIREIKTVNYRNFIDKEYNKDAQVLAVDLVDNAVVFDISAGKSGNYFATDISKLSDGEEYSGYYITNMKDDCDCVVITYPKTPVEDVPIEVTDKGYAYVLNAAFNDADFTEAWQLQLLTSDNEVEILTVGETITVDGEEISARTYDCNFLENFEAWVDWKTGADLDKGAHRLITYGVDSKNQIREINTVSATYFTDKEYNKDTQVLAADLVDNAVVFDISTDKSRNYFATDISALVNEVEYSGWYITNENDDIDCVVITYPEAVIEEAPIEVTDKGYAYVLNAAFNDADFTESWQLQLLTSGNEVEILTVGETITVDGEEISAKTADCDELEAFEAVEDADGADRDKGAHRVITYKLDSKNQIREIKTVDYTRFTDKEYNKEAQVLAADLADNAVLFDISASKADNYFATDISALVNGVEYSGFYITNANDDNDCVVITEYGSLIDYTQDIAVIASVTNIKIDEGFTDAKKVEYYTSEDDTLKTLTVVLDEDVTRMVESSYYDIQSGSLMMFHANGEDIALEVIVIASLDYDDAYVLNEDAVEAICEDDDDNSFVIGTIDDIKTVSAGKKVEATGIRYTKEGTEAAGFVTVKSSSNAYTYQNRNGMTIIHVGDWRANNVEAGEGYIFIARLLNGSVNDIITNSSYMGQVDFTEDEWDEAVDPEVPYEDYNQTIEVVSSVSNLDTGETEQEAKRVNYYVSSDKVCEYKIDTGSYVNIDNYEPSFDFSPIVSDFELIDIIDITDAEVTLVETDGTDYPYAGKNKIDIPFTIEVPDIDIDTPYITEP